MSAGLRSDRATLGLLLVLYLGWLLVPLASRPLDVPWTVDNGSKWLLAVAGENGFRTSLPYAGRDLDPELRFVPIAPPFAEVRDGRWVSQYPPTFSLLSRPFLRVASPWGGYLLPVLGALLASWGAARLAERLAAGQRDRDHSRGAFVWAFLLSGPLGPLCWYGTVFWEHTLVAALVVWGVVLAGPWRRVVATGRPGPDRAARAAGRTPLRPLVWAALAFALATWMREETAIVAAALVICLAMEAWPGSSGRPPRSGDQVADRRGSTATARRDSATAHRRDSTAASRRSLLAALRPAATFVVVYVVAIVPFLLWQKALTGAALGFHLSGNLRGSPWTWITTHRDAVVRGLLWSGDEGAMEAGDLFLTLVAVALAFAWARIPAGRIRSGLLLATSLVVGAVALVAWLALRREDDMPLTLIRTAGLLFFAPWVAWVAAARGREVVAVAWTGAVGIALFLLLTPAITAFGFHWGPRVLLSCLPLLAALAGVSLARASAVAPRWVAAVSAVALGVGCLALQGYGARVQIDVTRGARQYLEQTEAVLATGQAGAPVVTHQWWYAQTLVPVTLERPVYKVRNPEELREWFTRFRARGGREFFWATAAPHDEILAGLPVRVASETKLDGYPVNYRHRLLRVEFDGGKEAAE